MRYMRLLGLGFCVLVSASAAWGLPSLQLGPGAGNWTYDAASQTWETSDNPLDLQAFANATSTDGGNGAYAWDQTSTRYAYLLVAAEPKSSGGDLFDVTVSNDGGNLSLYTSGTGTPLPSHGIYSTYFEVYEFSFDGALTTIHNTQTGLDPAQGYAESFQIAVNSLASGVEGLHFDLFTVEGSGHLASLADIFANAPFSHDAGYVPEPGSVGVFSVGLLVAGGLIRRLRRSD